MGRRKSATEGKWFFDLLFYFFFSYRGLVVSQSRRIFFFCIGLNEPSLIAGRSGVVGARLYFFFLLKASKCVCMYVSVYLVVRIYQ